ncbi:MAG TPA: DUF1552 domain-containing protein [Polyangiaceae bacterium]|nr:DUF1552 domain-containing protein [Polyangiaceae bacterium]
MNQRNSKMETFMPSRRAVLRGAAGALLALPFLESLAPRQAQGQTMTPPKRFIVLKSFSTQLVKEWYPAFTGNGYALKNSKYSGSKADGTTLLTQKLVSGKNYTWAPLRDLKTDTGISGILGASLNPFLDKLTLIRGLDFLPSVNHNYGGLLGNFSSCTAATPCDADSLADVPTIDQVIAYSSKFYQGTPGVRSLHISQGVTDSMSYTNLGMLSGAVQQVKARTNPLDAFNDVFGTGAPSTGAPSPDRDKLLIDRVYQDYVKLKKSSRLSVADKQLLDQYTTLIAELQAKLTTTPTMACTAPATPQSLANNTGLDTKDITTKWNLFLDVVAAAIMCDRTRIITIGVHKALGPGPDSTDSKLAGFYHSEDASGGTWHGLAHDFSNENSRRMLKGINQWIANEVFAKLLTKLDVPEANGSTYLDNSLVYWGNELGFNHIAYSVPCLLAGSAGGFIKPGRYLDYIDWDGRSYFSQEDGNVIKGIPHNQFLVTALQAMGLQPADYERDGKPGYGSTSVNGRASDTWPVDYDLATVGQVLPGIRG